MQLKFVRQLFDTSDIILDFRQAISGPTAEEKEFLNAAENGSLVDVLRLLPTCNIDVRRCEDGRTPLLLAAGKGHLEVLKELYKKGADINAKDKHQFSAIHLAVRCGQLGVLSFLIEEANLAGRDLAWILRRAPTAKSLIISRLDKTVKDGKPKEDEKKINKDIYKITLDFKFFEHTPTDGEITLDPVTKSFREPESRDLLVHPLV